MDVYMKDICVLMTHSVVCQLAIQASTTNKQYIIMYLNHHIKIPKMYFSQNSAHTFTLDLVDEEIK